MRTLIAIGLVGFLGASAQVSADAKKFDKGSCSFGGKKLSGKVKFVTSFPDVKVKVVDSFPDVKVQKVKSFADDCGEWQVVTSGEDIKVQLVDSFPDVKIKYVTSFPGV